MNTGAPWPTLDRAEARVLGIQRKLHKWATTDQERRFCDLHNLVCDPATLLVAWRRVRGKTPDRRMTTGMLVESRMRGNVHVRFGGGLGETDRIERPAPRPGPT